MDKQNAKNEKSMVDMYNQEMKELQDSQKQIEEMYDDISEQLIGVLDCETMSLAIHLHGLCYRKIPENAVVILEEEMEQFAETFAKSPQMQKVMYGLIKAWKKETAEEISNEIEDILQVPYKGNTDKQMLIRKGMTEGLKMALEICKEIIGEEK